MYTEYVLLLKNGILNMCSNKPSYYKNSMRVSVSIHGNCADVELGRTLTTAKVIKVKKFSWIGRLKGESWEDRITMLN